MIQFKKKTKKPPRPGQTANPAGTLSGVWEGAPDCESGTASYSNETSFAFFHPHLNKNLGGQNPQWELTIMMYDPEKSRPLEKPHPPSFRKRVLLTTEQAAEFLGKSVSAMTIDRCRCVGPAYFKLGRSVRYDLSDLEAWLESCRIDPESI